MGAHTGAKPLPEDENLEETTRTLENLTTCKECIRISLVVPGDCRLDADLLSGRVTEMFVAGVFRDLCAGCHRENARE